MYQQFGRLQQAILLCDHELSERMAIVAEKFIAYRKMSGGFPEEGEQACALGKELSKSIPGNVYLNYSYRQDSAGRILRKNQVYESQVVPSASVTQSTNGQPNHKSSSASCVNILVDLSLTPTRIKEFRRSAPLSWTARPGTITVVHNTEDVFVVWGAGADGHPIKSADGNRVVLITNDSESICY